jgi:hypothetical protein
MRKIRRNLELDETRSCHDGGAKMLDEAHADPIEYIGFTAWP